MRASKYEIRNGQWYATDADGFNAEVVASTFIASLGPGGVSVRRGAHSVGFPMSWLADQPQRVVKALGSIHCDVREYPSTARHVVAIIKRQLDALAS